MGAIDKITYTLRCSCGARESQSLVQYGSAYGAGEWQAGKPFEQFLAVWTTGNLNNAPTIGSAKCKKCGSTAEISSS